ncbi:MAG TPA: hypothetical protein VI564_00050 [Candidatus Nanoarchaeia archaeon]|nr:hypothetical protein [Candidatus Nanoarchaeia archaeon]
MDSNIVETLETILAHPNGKSERELIAIAKRIFNPRTESHKLSLLEVARFEIVGPEVKNGKMGIYNGVLRGMLKELVQRGYRQGYLSYNEKGVTATAADARPLYLENPVIPIGILNGLLKIEETAKARELAVYFEAVGYKIGRNGEVNSKVRLNPLKSNGEVIKSNGWIVLDDKMKEIGTYSPKIHRERRYDLGSSCGDARSSKRSSSSNRVSGAHN